MTENRDDKPASDDDRVYGCLMIFFKIVVIGIALIALIFGTCILMLGR